VGIRDGAMVGEELAYLSDIIDRLLSHPRVAHWSWTVWKCALMVRWQARPNYCRSKTQQKRVISQKIEVLRKPKHQHHVERDQNATRQNLQED
jgi:hypothetical protein